MFSVTYLIMRSEHTHTHGRVCKYLLYIMGVCVCCDISSLWRVCKQGEMKLMYRHRRLKHME